MTKTKRDHLPSKDKELQEEMRQLVIARIKAASSDLRISIGSTEYTKKDLLKSLEEGDGIGQEIIDIQMEYLRDMAEGAIYKEEDE